MNMFCIGFITGIAFIFVVPFITDWLFEDGRNFKD